MYCARDTRLQCDVALKILPESFAADPDRLARFEQEVRAAAALNHPNILVVHDVGQHGGTPFIVSELLEGETLRERLQSTAVAVNGAGSGFQVGTPHQLFVVRPRAGGTLGYPYDVAADRQRFLVNTVTDEVVPEPLSVIINWPALLEQ